VVFVPLFSSILTLLFVWILVSLDLLTCMYKFLLFFCLFSSNLYSSVFLLIWFFFTDLVLLFKVMLSFIDFALQSNLICKCVYLQWHVCMFIIYFSLFFFVLSISDLLSCLYYWFEIISIQIINLSLNFLGMNGYL
jgi:hypothetical protein